MAIASVGVDVPRAIAQQVETEAIEAQNRSESDRNAEADRLFDQGTQHRDAEQFQEALQAFQQALIIYREIDDRLGESITLSAIGYVYLEDNQVQEALQTFQQALMIDQEIRDRLGEGISLRNIGDAYLEMEQYQQAIEFYQQALAIAQEVQEVQELNAGTFEPYILLNIGRAYDGLNDGTQAIEYFQRSLARVREINAPLMERAILSHVGYFYYDLEQYGQALEFTEQAVAIREEQENRDCILCRIGLLHRLGHIYEILNQHEQAMEIYEQTLSLARRINDPRWEGEILGGIARVYESLERYERALEFYQLSLEIARNENDTRVEGFVLSNISNVYFSLGNYSKSLEFSFLALEVLEQEETDGCISCIGRTLNRIGRIYNQLNQDDRAYEFYQQALIVARGIGDRLNEKQALSNLAELLAAQNQPELAIVLYKQSVNIIEEIRHGIRNLPLEQQESYVQSEANTYRQLADLLISQGRLGEAQQVLELLKLQELRDFTRSADVGGISTQLPLADVEQQMLDEFGTLTAFSQRLHECEQSQCAELSQLRDRLDARTIEFNNSIEQLRQTLRDRLAQDPGFLSSEALNSTAREIVTAEPGTVLVYPLVLEDKIRILLAIRSGENGVIFRAFESDVNQQELWQTVSEFRQQLGDTQNGIPTTDIATVQATAQQLYDWLIEPLQAELQGQEVQHLVFALDRSTRYIPMAALFDADRQQYLIEQYAVSTILAAELTDMSDRLSPNPADNPVLAMGVAMSVGGMPPLANVPTELNAIVQTGGTDSQGVFPGAEFLDRAFNFSALRDNLSGRRILHIATHAKFQSGRPEDSFLLSGDGEIRIGRIQTLVNYGLDDVHLVVLSACETAVGGPDESGIEIPGISYYFLQNGARSVLASLWLVNDPATSALMQQFYGNLAGGMTKAEALRQAQLSLLNGNAEASRADRSGDATVTAIDTRTGQPRSSLDVRHPYYWAPFILIGNGL
ncbi:CHAT domain-containing protein [Microcoleus sp. FACHB-1515]|uniref:CHAT domain-containing tetratricopeptide repeat protein n=1 Tax=Cyanophyceae TaxID=3028117 RepID=UPI0016856FC1|nr:CHAT domain-containing protein [Microcoleus sp. FACHB-1515]MBD2091277.1 CHAT domain-containing protein [Microcoleus sp. FACHB-1515]